MMASARGWLALAMTAASIAPQRAVIAQGPTLRASVEVVTIDAYVHDEGRAIEGLTAADFIVRDNGVEQAIDALATTTSAHVIVALDVSGSVSGDASERLRLALRRLLTLLTPDDRVSLMTFGDRLRIHAVAEPPDVDLERVVRRTTPVGSTALHDAIVAGSQLSRADRRPALLVLLTDGADTSSWTAASRVLDALRRTHVVVVVVGAGLPDTVASRPDSAYFRWATWRAAMPGDTLRLMQMLAATTGGEFLKVDRGARLDDVFTAVLRRYRQRYLLSFTPTGVSTPGWHRLDVRVRQRRGTVMAREGYVVP